MHRPNSAYPYTNLKISKHHEFPSHPEQTLTDIQNLFYSIDLKKIVRKIAFIYIYIFVVMCNIVLHLAFYKQCICVYVACIYLCLILLFVFVKNY